MPKYFGEKSWVFCCQFTLVYNKGFAAINLQNTSPIVVYGNLTFTVFFKANETTINIYHVLIQKINSAKIDTWGT